MGLDKRVRVTIDAYKRCDATIIKMHTRSWPKKGGSKSRSEWMKIKGGKVTSSLKCKHGINIGRCDACACGDAPFHRHGH